MNLSLIARRAARVLLPTIALLMLAPAAQRAHAWSASGHMIAAAIAYRELPLPLRTQWYLLLREHPSHDQWMREAGDSVEFGVYLFMRAAVWPDELRREQGAEAHPEWHYVNYPLVPPEYPMREPLPSPNGNILMAIEHNAAVLRDLSQPAQRRAIALAWLLHLVADLHQPLHVVAVVDETWPAGDRGGNEIFFRTSDTASRAMPLHAVWDGLLGRVTEYTPLLNQVIAIADEHPRERLAEQLRSAPDVQAWARESRSLAIDSVYAGARGGVTRERQAEAAVLSEEYTTRATSVARRRVALAGYRLADLLIR